MRRSDARYSSWTLAGAGGHKVQAHSARAILHAACIHAIAAEFADGALRQCIVRHDADHARIVAEARERDRDIGFGAAIMRRELRRLQQQFAAGRRQANKQFAETDEAGHVILLMPAQRASQPPSTGMMAPWT